MPEINDVLASWLVYGSDENWDYLRKKAALERDSRKTPSVRYNSIDQQYKELNEYQKSDTFRNVSRVKHLMSDKFEINSDQLGNVMRTNYSLGDSEFNQAMKQLAMINR